MHIFEVQSSHERKKKKKEQKQNQTNNKEEDDEMNMLTFHVKIDRINIYKQRKKRGIFIFSWVFVSMT